MRRALLSCLTALAAMSWGPAPVSSQTPGPANTAPVQVAPSAAFVAELSKSVDAKKAKRGDQTFLKLTMDVLRHGAIVIPRGTKIVGHIIDARARTRKSSESMIAIAFDHIAFKNGREVPLSATIQAVGMSAQALPPSVDTADLDLQNQTSSKPAPGPNEMRHNMTAAFPGSRRPASAESGADESAGLAGETRAPESSLGPTSHGVVGMKGVLLRNSAQGSALSSNHGNVHLNSGTQLILRISQPDILFESLQKTKN